MPRRLTTEPLPEIGTVEPLRLTRAVNAALSGRQNATFNVTVAAGTTATSVTDSAFGANTVLIPAPRSAEGAALDIWLAGRARGQITLGHAAPATDLLFDFVAIG